MDDIAIRVEGLGKRFRLRHTNGGSHYRTLREDMLGLPRRLLAGLRGRRDEREEFWALKDVSFEVKRGEVLGIIGRNGAGKSTLLKILSRIMDPTCGEAKVHGRIGSLLEVGTGFHPELTGRENIFLSGALLGMRRDEVWRRFDEIVAFAGVEKFLDTACKHYSSGMYARLGFAVAAHLDAEILLVDEVLAVGDAEFQKRCLGKIGAIAKDGRTVLFVSHNLGVIRQICSHGVFLKDGKVCATGFIDNVVECYVAEQCGEGTELMRVVPGNAICGVELVRLSGNRLEGGGGFRWGDSVQMELDICVRKPIQALQAVVRVSTGDGVPVFTTSNADMARKVSGVVPGRYRLTVGFPAVFAPGSYRLIIALCEPKRIEYDLIDSQIGFSVDPVGSIQMDLNDARKGCIEIALPWSQKVLYEG